MCVCVCEIGRVQKCLCVCEREIDTLCEGILCIFRILFTLGFCVMVCVYVREESSKVCLCVKQRNINGYPVCRNNQNFSNCIHSGILYHGVCMCVCVCEIGRVQKCLCVCERVRDPV